MVAEAEAEELPLSRSSYGTLGLVRFELEPARQEAGDAVHHPPPGPLAADVDVAVLRIPNEAMWAVRVRGRVRRVR
jgi:hypothetical protein